MPLGPVGLVASLQLAQRGYEVHCYEKRPDDTPTTYKQSPPRSVFYALGRRGLEPLELTGVQVSLTAGRPTLSLSLSVLSPAHAGAHAARPAAGRAHAGRQPHAVQAQAQALAEPGGARAAAFAAADDVCGAQPAGPGEAVALLNTGLWLRLISLLSQHLAAETQRLQPGRITLHYESSLQALDTQQQTATFSTADGGTSTASYDLLVACGALPADLACVSTLNWLELPDKTAVLLNFSAVQARESAADLQACGAST